MRTGWTTTKLITIGTLGVLNLLTHWIFYNSVLVASGSALVGIIALLISPFFITITILLTDQLGAATLFLLITVILDLPSPKLFPPLVNFATIFLAGVPIDISSRLLKKHHVFAAFLSGTIYNLTNGTAAIILFYSVGLFGTRHLPKFLTTLPGLLITDLIMTLVGGLCGLLAWTVYQKISHTNVVRRIQKATNV